MALSAHLNIIIMPIAVATLREAFSRLWNVAKVKSLNSVVCEMLPSEIFNLLSVSTFLLLIPHLTKTTQSNLEMVNILIYAFIRVF